MIFPFQMQVSATSSKYQQITSFFKQQICNFVCRIFYKYLTLSVHVDPWNQNNILLKVFKADHKWTLHEPAGSVPRFWLVERPSQVDSYWLSRPACSAPPLEPGNSATIYFELLRSSNAFVLDFIVYWQQLVFLRFLAR